MCYCGRGRRARTPCSIYPHTSPCPCLPGVYPELALRGSAGQACGHGCSSQHTWGAVPVPVERRITSRISSVSCDLVPVRGASLGWLPAALEQEHPAAQGCGCSLQESRASQPGGGKCCGGAFQACPAPRGAAPGPWGALVPHLLCRVTHLCLLPPRDVQNLLFGDSDEILRVEVHGGAQGSSSTFLGAAHPENPGLNPRGAPRQCPGQVG